MQYVVIDTNDYSKASKCTLKLAVFAAQAGKFEKAIEVYEEVSRQRIESSLLKYSAAEYYFRATLCHLCTDLVNAQVCQCKDADFFN